MIGLEDPEDLANDQRIPQQKIQSNSTEGNGIWKLEEGGDSHLLDFLKVSQNIILTGDVIANRTHEMLSGSASRLQQMFDSSF